MNAAARVTSRAINARLRRFGERLAVQQSAGCVMVFDTSAPFEAARWPSTSIAVCYVRDLGDTVDAAVATVRAFIAQQRGLVAACGARPAVDAFAPRSVTCARCGGPDFASHPCACGGGR